VAEVMSHLVLPTHQTPTPRACADALEQTRLIKAESATWRMPYLLGALELRQAGRTGRARTR